MTDKTGIILPDEILSSLYKNSLVSIPEIAESSLTGKSVKTSADAIVITSHKGSPLPAGQQIFLQNILKACKLDPVNIPVLKADDPITANYQAMHEQYASSKLVLFGMSTAEIALPIRFPNYQVQSFQGVQYLCADSLEVLEHDKNLKAILWKSLQQLFL